MKQRTCILIPFALTVPILIITVLFLVSCPGLITDENVLQVKDETGPVITIFSPANGSSYASMVLVMGRVEDYASGSEKGGIKNLYYVVVPSAVPGGEIEVAEDGSFSFYFPTDNFSGSFVVTIIAEDWNGNITTLNLSLLDEGAIPTFRAIPNNKSVAFVWDDVPFATSYTLHNMRYGESRDVTSGYIWPDLNNGELYSFRLQAHSSMGEENWSETQFAIPLSPFTLIPVFFPGHEKIEVQWHRLTGVDEYALYRSTDVDTGYTIRAVTATNRFVDTNVQLGQTYYYRVEPYGQEGIECNPNATRPSMVTDEAWQVVGSNDTGFYNARGIALSGDYAYVAADSNDIQIYNIGDPYNPSHVGGFTITGDAYDVAVHNGNLYVASSSGIFMGYSLADPENPTFLGSKSTGLILGFDVYGDRAYLANGTKLSIIDITNTTYPVVGTSQATFAGNANDVVVDANYAYMANGYDGFWIISTTSPYATVGKIDHTDPQMQNCHRVAVWGNHAYVIAEQGHLFSINISNPATPVKKDRFDIPGNGFAEGLVILGNQAWVADNQSNTTRIIDVSDENNLVEVGYRLHDGRPKAIYISGNYAYVVGSSFGLDIIHATFSNPTVVHTWTMPYGATDFAISGNYAYVAESETAYDHWFRVIDITDHTDQITGFIQLSGIEGDYYVAAARANYAYIDYWGLKIIDASDPSQPYICNLEDPGISPQKIAILGDYGYMSQGTDLHVVDISDPVLPSVIDTISLPEGIIDVAVTGDYVYVVSNNPLLRAIDQYDPFFPVVETSSESVNAVRGFTISGDYAYVTTWEGGSTYLLKIIDLNTSNYPMAGWIDTGGWVSNLAVSGAYAFIAAGSSGVQIVNVSEPAKPFHVKYINAGGSVSKVEISGRYLYAIVDGNIKAIDLFAD